MLAGCTEVYYYDICEKELGNEELIIDLGQSEDISSIFIASLEINEYSISPDSNYDIKIYIGDDSSTGSNNIQCVCAECTSLKSAWVYCEDVDAGLYMISGRYVWISGQRNNAMTELMIFREKYIHHVAESYNHPTLVSGSTEDALKATNFALQAGTETSCFTVDTTTDPYVQIRLKGSVKISAIVFLPLLMVD